jgi:ammonium transporter Rh
MFGAYFGIAVSRSFRTPKPFSVDNSKSNVVSDILSLLGTTLLWVYWPSFVSATETGTIEYENHCVIHTVLALVGSTSATFFLSHKLVGKLDPFHIANSTLAGGVAVGSSARLDMTPGGALLLGVIAGVVSVLGFVYVSPVLERKFSTHDTCGVHNLHGLPSVTGGLASAIFVTMDSSAEFLEFGKGQQAFHQILAVLSTIAFALMSGWVTGIIMVMADNDNSAEYYDGTWWEGEYFEEVLQGGEGEQAALLEFKQVPYS